MDFVLANIPYNMSVRDDGNSKQNIFSSGDMKAMSKRCGEMLRHEAHAHIFCTVLQFGLRYSVLSKKMEVQEGTGWFGSDSDREGRKEETAIFQLQSVLLHFTRAVRTYCRSPAARSTQSTNFAEEATRFRQKASSREEVLVQWEFKGHEELLTMNIWWTKRMNHISGVPAEDRAVVTDDETYGRILALRFEQKELSGERVIFETSHRPGKQSLTLEQVPLATANSCMLLPRHSRFFVATLTPSVSKTYYLGLWRGLRDQLYMRSWT